MLHYSTGCSVISSSATEPFALHAGGMEAQRKYSLEMRAPIHMQTEGKLLLYCSHHTEVHIVPSPSFPESKHLLKI